MQRGVTQRWTGWLLGLTALAGSAIATVHTQAAEAVSPSNPPVPLIVPDGASGRWSGESAVSRLTGLLPAATGSANRACLRMFMFCI